MYVVLLTLKCLQYMTDVTHGLEQKKKDLPKAGYPPEKYYQG